MVDTDGPFFMSEKVAGVTGSACFPDAPRDCPRCPRLSDFRNSHRKTRADWHNAPVPSFGDSQARLLIVGLAPGLQGANRTGRPFTGDYAGDLLYDTLARFGFSSGTFQARPDDGLTLHDCLITNAVRCVPPENKPTPEEIRNCRPFLEATMAAMPRLKAMIALGRISHESLLRSLSVPLKSAPFAHGARHIITDGSGRSLSLFDSYHCSRYNTNTGVLTPDMFRSVFAAVRAYLDEAA